MVSGKPSGQTASRGAEEETNGAITNNVGVNRRSNIIHIKSRSLLKVKALRRFNTKLCK